MPSKKIFVFLSLSVVALCAVANAVEISPYGFVLADTMEEWGRPTILDVPTAALSQSKPDATGTFNEFDARQSRLGLRIDDIDGWNHSKVSGVIEGDFFGDMATATSGSGPLQASARIRLAYAQVKWQNSTLVFGQDWTMAFSPINPVSLVHQAIPSLSSSGNLWNRIPQIRWDFSHDLNSDGLKLNTKVALLRAFTADETADTSLTTASQLDQPGSGEASGQPTYQALAELSQKISGGTETLGASVQYLQQKYPPGLLSGTGVPTSATNNSISSLLGGIHAVIPLGPKAEISGEGFYGHGDQNLQGLGQVYTNAAGTLETSIVRGGWGQFTLKPLDNWAVHLMCGTESINQTGLAAASAYRNETYIGNLVWDWGKELSWSLEYGRIHTYYVASLAGSNQYTALAAMLKFGK